MMEFILSTLVISLVTVMLVLCILHLKREELEQWLFSSAVREFNGTTAFGDWVFLRSLGYKALGKLFLYEHWSEMDGIHLWEPPEECRKAEEAFDKEWEEAQTREFREAKEVVRSGRLPFVDPNDQHLRTRDIQNRPFTRGVGHDWRRNDPDNSKDKRRTRFRRNKATIRRMEVA
jgi:hypothetical protein